MHNHNHEKGGDGRKSVTAQLVPEGYSQDEIDTPQEKCSLIEHQVMGPNLTAAEGFILRVGAKMFTIAGPVIVYGVAASVVYGLMYWITTLF